MSHGEDRRARLARARLYLVSDAAIDGTALEAALAGGVDMLQLRDAALDDDALLAVAARWRQACDRHGALLWINDRPDLALAAERRRRARGPGRRRRRHRAPAGG